MSVVRPATNGFPEEITDEVRSSSTESFDDRWESAAARLLASLDGLGSNETARAELDPGLEQLLRRVIHARARRWSRQLGGHGLGIDPEDVAQRVLLQLVENPPRGETTGRALGRLLAWARVVTHNYLCGLSARGSERLQPHDLDEAEERRSGVAESRYAAREALLRMREIVGREYPLGLALLDLLLESPHATSRELAVALETSPANVDQIRSRIRRVLRNHLGESESPGRKPR